MNSTTGTTRARRHSTIDDSVVRRGRATRPQFWWSALVSTIASVTLTMRRLNDAGRGERPAEGSEPVEDGAPENPLREWNY